MINRDRLKRYKAQSLASIKAQTDNRHQLGVSLVNVSPGDLLELILTYEEVNPEQPKPEEGKSP